MWHERRQSRITTYDVTCLPCPFAGKGVWRRTYRPMPERLLRGGITSGHGLVILISRPPAQRPLAPTSDDYEHCLVKRRRGRRTRGWDEVVRSGHAGTSRMVGDVNIVRYSFWRRLSRNRSRSSRLNLKPPRFPSFADGMVPSRAQGQDKCTINAGGLTSVTFLHVR